VGRNENHRVLGANLLDLLKFLLVINNTVKNIPRKEAHELCDVFQQKEVIIGGNIFQVNPRLLKKNVKGALFLLRDLCEGFQETLVG